MKQSFKKSISIFLAALLIFTTAPFFGLQANAAEIVESGDLPMGQTWQLDSDGVLTINGTGEMQGYLHMPWYLHSDKITSVVIADGITSIKSRAFGGLNKLTNVTIPDSVEEIESEAFSGCSSLVTLTIPKSVKKIEAVAFGNCPALTNITIPGSVESIGISAFYDCTALKNVTIQNGVAEIGNYAFSGCTALESIAIPNSVTGINATTFNGCSALKSIVFNKDNAQYTFENGVLYNKEKTTFFGMLNSENITSFTVPDGVTTIEKYAFSDYTALTGITLPNSVKVIGDYAYQNCTSLKNIDLPDGITSIGSGAFSSCSSLTSVVIPDGVTTIQSFTFNACTSLTSLTLPKNITTIGSGAFGGCSSLKSITLPSRITSIPQNTFSSCKALEKIVIPGNVKTIGQDAFANCESLVSVTISDGVEYIEKYAFDRCTSLTAISLPDSITELYASFGDTAYYKDEANWTNGVLYIGNHLIKAKEDLAGTYSVKNGTKTIAPNAFDGCASVTGITIPESVVFIGASAFQDCTSLASINLPQGITAINSYTFSNCTSLASITVPEGATIIESGAFDFCTSLASISLPDSITIQEESFNHTAYYNNEANWENGVLYINNHLIKAKPSLTGAYTVKSGTKTIASEAFGSYESYGYGQSDICTSVTSISIPDSVTYIGYGAFANCTSLAQINFPDSLTYIGTWVVAGTAFYKNEDNWTNGLLYIGNHLIDENGSCAGTVVVREGTLSLAGSALGSTTPGGLTDENRKITSVVLPDSLLYIGRNAFLYTPLQSITIGKNVKRIFAQAFLGIDNLTVYYAGSPSDWKKIEIGGMNKGLDACTIFFGEDDSAFTNSDNAVLTANGDLIGTDGTTVENLLQQAGTGAKLYKADGTEKKTDAKIGTGDKLVLADGTELIVSVLGDLNGDGEVATSDARLALRKAVNLETFDNAHSVAADVDNNKEVGVADARMILRASVNLDKAENWFADIAK